MNDKRPTPWLGMCVNIAWPIGFVVMVIGIATGEVYVIVPGLVLMGPAMVLPQGPGWREYWDKHEQRVREWEARQ